jgi:hypothetical protein
LSAQGQPIATDASQQGSTKAAALAVALDLLLIDGAVETLVSGSPVRWWVAGLVAAHLAISVGLWRYRRTAAQGSLGWNGFATATFLFLLGLLAFTAWLPGGLTEGIRLLGQPTSRVLSLLSIAAITLAAVSLVRIAWLPRWGKLLVLLLAAYGLVAFAKGIIQGTEFSDLLHGASLWMRLPFWLQGAFVGAIIMTPAGLLARGADVIKSSAGDSRSWNLSQVVALGLSILIAVPAVTSSGYGPQPTAAEIVQPLAKSYQELEQALAGPKPKTPPTPQQIADRLDKLFPMLEQAEKQIPRDTFDPQAIIDKVGKDPEKLFEWVRDNTYFVPYKGLLRGEKGVLMDRLGNSVDRAMLLYALLKYIDQPARLAHGTLTEARAKDVLAKVPPFPRLPERTSSRSVEAKPSALISQYAKQNDMDVAKVNKAFDQVVAQQQRVRDLVQERIGAQAAIIARLVGPPPRSALQADREEQQHAVTDHWWVQWEDGTNWLDLDPTLPGSTPGQPLTAVQRTLVPNSYTDIGKDLVHSVEIQIIIEVLEDGQARETSLLQREIVPASVIGEPIIVSNVPISWLQGPSNLPAVNDQDEWFPTLTIGGQTLLQYSFNKYGEITDLTLPSIAEQQGLQQLGGGIGGMLSNHQQPAPSGKAKRSQVTAEWLQYKIHAPGSPTRTVRRALMDMIGPAARDRKEFRPPHTEDNILVWNLALLSSVYLGVTPCDISPAFVAHLRAEELLRKRDALREFVSSAYQPKSASLPLGSPAMTVAASKLFGLMVGRGQLRDTFTRSVYVDHTNIFSLVKKISADDRSTVIAETLDIVANDVSSGGSPADSFQARLRQGVIDTNLEAVVSSDCYKVGRYSACEPTNSAAEMLSKVGIGQAVVVVTVGDAGLRRSKLPPDVLHRIRDDIDSGFTVVLARATLRDQLPLQVAWWRIKMDTGATVGIGADGAGEATETEHMTLTEKVTEEIKVETPFMLVAFGICKSFCHSDLACAAVALGEGAAGGVIGILDYRYVLLSGAVVYQSGVETAMCVSVLGLAVESMLATDELAKGEDPCQKGPDHGSPAARPSVPDGHSPAVGPGINFPPLPAGSGDGLPPKPPFGERGSPQHPD